MKNTTKKKLTSVSVFHYIRLVYRSLLFIAIVTVYVLARIYKKDINEIINEYPYVFIPIWCVFAFEMVFRFFPSKIESPGCQKQFKKNYIKSGNTDIKVSDNHATVLVLIVWISANLIIGALYNLKIIDTGIMIILSSAYSIGDMVCILFFCPFQTWFLKNKCCTTCRIYNWDYAMMFTPFIFVRSFYTWSLVAMSLILFLRWEITYYVHPERFSENTNECLKCENCNEKLCAHKEQLKTLWNTISKETQERIKKLKK